MKQTNTHLLSCVAQFFLEWEMFHTKFVQKLKTHILCSVTFFFENRAVCEIMWENTVERGRTQMTIWRSAMYAGHLRLQTHTHNM